jgi:hypothetical protein
MADRVIHILEQNREKDFDSREMFERLRLPNTNLASVRSTLYRLYEEHRILRPSPGRFAALEQNQTGITQPDGGNANRHGVKNAAA